MYKIIDIEDEASNEGAETLTLEQVMEEINQWNKDLGTDYKSIEDFNVGEGYYQIVKIN